MKVLAPFKSITLIDDDVLLDKQLDTDRAYASELKPDELILRFWQANGVILGKLDSILPDFEAGLAYLQQHNQATLIRKAGGLAVVCDSGILNLSLLFPKDHPLYGGLNEAYEFGVVFIQEVLKDLGQPITPKEIQASYCPGKYDLSIHGKKFCGMAQYRTKDAVMLMMTLCVTGNQTQRCELIKGFYDLANPMQDPKYPQIDPKVMATLSDLTQHDFDVESIKTLIQQKCCLDGTFDNVQKQM